MKKYSDGTSIVDATQWFQPGDHPAVFPSRFGGGVMVMITPTGQVAVAPGDWVVSGLSGNFLPVKNEEFQQKYKPVTTKTK